MDSATVREEGQEETCPCRPTDWKTVFLSLVSPCVHFVPLLVVCGPHDVSDFGPFDHYDNSHNRLLYLCLRTLCPRLGRGTLDTGNTLRDTFPYLPISVAVKEIIPYIIAKSVIG